MIWAALVGGLVFALASSLHCVGMCGPLALSIKLNSKNDSSSFVVYYHLGRLLSYLVLGLFIGLFGEMFTLFIPSQIFSVAIGIFILLSLLFNNHINTFFNKISWLTKVRNKFLHNAHPFFLGIGNGLIPCGLVYTAFGLGLMYGNLVHNMVFVLGFGLGTFPATVAIQLLGKKLNLKKYIKPALSKYVVAFMALLFIVRGLNLGIPYFSPELASEDKVEKVNCCNK